MNVSKLVLAAILAFASPVIACSPSDDGKTTDTSGTEGRRTSRSDDDDSDTRDSRDSDERNDGPSTQQDPEPQTQECRGSSVCINGSCKCESGPNKGKSCCYAPEEEDDPPCAKANECDNVCNSCN